MDLNKYNTIKELLPMWDVDIEQGIVRTKRGQITRKCKAGYLEVHAYKDGKHYYIRVHQIIAVAGGLDCIGKDIDHIDGNKLNNRLDNLEAVTPMENTLRAWAQGQSKYYTAKINGKAAAFIKTLLKYKMMSVEEIAKRFNLSPSYIKDIKHGKTWKDVEPYDFDEFIKI